jgi:hypothetical protein
MRINIQGRRPQVAAALVALFLAIAVFGWGLQYKLSLYDHPSDHPSSAPHAKLLSQKERPASSNAVGLIVPDTRQLQSSVLLLALLVWTISLGSYVTQFSWMRSRALISYSSQQRSAVSNYFAFRPPPTIFLSN